MHYLTNIILLIVIYIQLASFHIIKAALTIGSTKKTENRSKRVRLYINIEYYIKTPTGFRKRWPDEFEEKPGCLHIDGGVQIVACKNVIASDWS